MNTESIGPYSPDTVYGQLTMPFVFDTKKVIINAHTPYDKTDDEAAVASFSKSNFVGAKVASFRYSVEDIHEMKMAEPMGVAINKGDETEKEQDFPPKNVADFTASSLSAQDIVRNRIKMGDSPNNSVNVAKAYKAYSNDSILFGKTPIKALGNRSFNVHQ